MLASIVPIVTILGSIFLALFHAWQTAAPARAQEDHDEKVQQGRTDITAGNAAAVTERIDRVLTVQADTAAGSDARSAGDPPGEGDSGTLARMAALGLIGSEAPGSGGTGAGEAAVIAESEKQFPFRPFF